MFSTAAVLTYGIGAVFTVAIAYVVRFVDKNTVAKLFLFVCAFYAALPFLMLSKFFRGEGKLGGKRKSMTPSDQAVAVILILLLTYWIALRVNKERDKKRTISILKIKEPSKYKVALEPPIERRLARVVPNHGVA